MSGGDEIPATGLSRQERQAPEATYLSSSRPPITPRDKPSFSTTAALCPIRSFFARWVVARSFIRTLRVLPTNRLLTERGGKTSLAAMDRGGGFFGDRRRSRPLRTSRMCRPELRGRHDGRFLVITLRLLRSEDFLNGRVQSGAGPERSWRMNEYISAARRRIAS